MTRPRLAAVSVIVLATSIAGVVGCGDPAVPVGTATDTPVAVGTTAAGTDAGFLGSADRICTDARAAMTALGPADADALGPWTQAAEQIMMGVLDRMRALTIPGDLMEPVTSIEDAWNTGATVFRNAADDLESGADGATVLAGLITAVEPIDAQVAAAAAVAGLTGCAPDA